MMMTNPEITAWLHQPNERLDLSDISQLDDFENEVADFVLPEGMDPYSTNTWMSRTALRYLVRPPHFVGTIQGIHIAALDEPYERLLDAKQRGLEFNTAGGRPNATTNAKSIERTQAFKLQFETVSGINKTGGVIETEAWYMPTASAGRAKPGFLPVRRVVAIPKLYKNGVDGKELISPTGNKYRGIKPDRYTIHSLTRGTARRFGQI